VSIFWVRQTVDADRRLTRKAGRCRPKTDQATHPEFRTGFIFISHDIAVISYFSDRVAVIHQGELVEE
jgi:ABC-type polysaccharide/polyol phosphate transport system ATPase subunit